MKIVKENEQFFLFLGEINFSITGGFQKQYPFLTGEGRSMQNLPFTGFEWSPLIGPAICKHLSVANKLLLILNCCTFAGEGGGLANPAMKMKICFYLPTP